MAQLEQNADTDVIIIISIITDIITMKMMIILIL